MVGRCQKSFLWILKFSNENVVNIKNLKQELNHGLILKKVYRVIK